MAILVSMASYITISHTFIVILFSVNKLFDNLPSDMPFNLKLKNGVEVTVDIIPTAMLPEIYEFYCTHGRPMNGVSIDEFADEEDFVTKSTTRFNISVREATTGILIAYNQVFYL